MNKKPSPDYVLRDSTGERKADLLDRVLANGERNLKSQGINLEPKKDPEAMTNWATIDGMYEALRQSIMYATLEINQAYIALQGKKYSTASEVELVVSTTNQDLETFADKLNAIRARHSDKEGLIQDGPDLALSMGISSDYIMLGEEVKGLVFPTMLTLTEAVRDAHQTELKEAAEKQPEEVK